ncbi:MAG: hypothetical protein GXP62_07645 [Oligoflexia bacterium]|nr:hypothetical protein [Oligoflexia bacterium]
MAMGVGWLGTPTSWSVFDGGGARLTPIGFADAVGDTAGVLRMRKHRRVSVGLLAGGLTLWGSSMAGTVGLLIASNSSANQDQLINAAGVLTGVSLASIPVGLTGMIMLLTKDTNISGNYTTSEADAWIEKYNAKLREELGLSEQDVQILDLQTRRWIRVYPILAQTGSQFAPGLAISGVF